MPPLYVYTETDLREAWEQVITLPPPVWVPQVRNAVAILTDWVGQGLVLWNAMGALQHRMVGAGVDSKVVQCMKAAGWLLHTGLEPEAAIEAALATKSDPEEPTGEFRG